MSRLPDCWMNVTCFEVDMSEEDLEVLITLDDPERIRWKRTLFIRPTISTCDDRPATRPAKRSNARRR